MPRKWANAIIGWDEVAPDQLLANPSNYRRHPPAQREALRGSLNELDIIAPVIVNRTSGHLVDGHARVEEYLTAGVEKVPVAYVELTEAQERLALLALDPVAAMAEADKQALDDLLSEITTGEAGLQQMLADLAKGSGLEYGGNGDGPQDPGAQIDRAEELREKWQTERGQVWEVGKHRVMCGDATSAEDVGRLLGSARPSVVFTDPPYGIGQDIENDDLTGDAFDSFNGAWLSVTPTADNASFVCYHSTRTFPSALWQAQAAGWKFERMLWFYRPDKFPAHTWNGWMMVGQSIMLFSKGVPEYLKLSPADQDTYRHTSSELGEKHGHPTEKLLGHSVAVMRHFGGEDVYDPFLGSGTTAVAAEQLNRICYGMELEPKYVAVTLERLAGMGLEPRRATEERP